MEGGRCFQYDEQLKHMHRYVMIPVASSKSACHAFATPSQRPDTGWVEWVAWCRLNLRLPLEEGIGSWGQSACRGPLIREGVFVYFTATPTFATSSLGAMGNDG